MKKVISLLIVAILIVSVFGCNALAAEQINYLRTHLESTECILYDINTDTVHSDSNNRFNENGALNYIFDGDTVTQTNVYGALDWIPPKYVGVLCTLDGEYDIDTIKITSGQSTYPDTYRVYAGTDLETLYTYTQIVADNLVIENETATIVVSNKVKYIAVFCIDYKICQRIKEIEAWGINTSVEPDIPSVDDEKSGLKAVGNKIYMGDTKMNLRGVNVPQFSWSAYGDGANVSGQTAADIALNQALNEWNASIIRLAVDPNVYVNGGVGSGGGQTVSKTAMEYQDLIDSFITRITDAGVVAILDCHGYGGAYQNIVDFWNIAAPKYDNNELVIYGLLNEPISSWEVWFEGGNVDVPHLGQTSCIGIPALLDRVRTLSDNVVAIGGVDYAFDLSKISSVGFESFAEERAKALGITVSEYTSRYSLKKASRQGRGIILDTHIYSHKPVNWDYYIGAASKEFPILVGEYNPYFRNGFLTELTPQEKAFLQKIFSWITANGFASTSWSLGAEPFLTDHSGNLTAIGVAVKEFVKTGKWNCAQPENLIYQHYASARGVVKSTIDGKISYKDNFLGQAHFNGKNIKNSIITNIIDGETDTHYDIYETYDYSTGVEFTLDDIYACHEIRVTSGVEGYPDKCIVYASDKLEDLYSAENIIENATTEHTGTVAYKINKKVKYVAFVALGYVRFKEFSLSGVYFGDMNADDYLNSADVVMLRRHLIDSPSIETEVRGDINRDSQVDIRDIINFKKKLAE